jgi:hypothetical protein
MKIASYNPTTMALLLSDTTAVNFGRVIRGNHAAELIVLKAVPETETLDMLALFLENNAGMNHTRFSNFKSSTAITGIQPGDPRLAAFFVPVTGISDIAGVQEFSDWGLMLNASAPEYTWLDARVGSTESPLNTSGINYRFVFEYH